MGTTSARVRIAVVGCGAIAREAHLPVLLAEPTAALAALCDRDRARASLTAREFGLSGVPLVTDLADLAGRADAAILAVPPALHAPLAVRLLELGLDVLCEKPLATSVADGQQMIDAATRHQRVLAVALMTRFFAHNPWITAAIEDGDLGDLEAVIAEDGAPLDWDMPTNAYFDRRMTGGGVLFDAGIHMLDRLLWLFGPLADAGYHDDAFGAGFEANAELTGTFTIAGRVVPARLTVSWSHRLPRRIQVIGSAATLEATTADPRTLTLRRRGRRGTVTSIVQCAERWHARSAYQAQLRDFIAAVRERRPPTVTATSALEALAVIEAAYARRRPLDQPWLAPPPRMA